MALDWVPIRYVANIMNENGQIKSDKRCVISQRLQCGKTIRFGGYHHIELTDCCHLPEQNPMHSFPTILGLNKMTGLTNLSFFCCWCHRGFIHKRLDVSMCAVTEERRILQLYIQVRSNYEYEPSRQGNLTRAKNRN